MGAYFPDRQDQKNDVALSAHPLYVSLRPFVASFVEQVRSASSPEDLYAAHRKLFEKTFEYRANLELVGDNIKAGRSEIKTLAQQDPKPTSRLSRQHTELQALKAAKRAAKAALSILRSLGDTLVWFALGFDRVAITALGEGQRVGYLSSGVGLDAELRALDILWADGVFAILNDLTNCLRHGDVTTVEWTHDQRDVRIAEVKAGRPLHEAARQARRLEDVVKLLQTGQHDTLDQGGPLYVERSPVGYRTHVAQLADLLHKARRDGYAWGKPSPCVVVEAFNEAGDHDMTREQFIASHTRMCDRVGWWAADDEPLYFSAATRRLRDRRHASASLAPVALLPLPLDDLVDVVAGRLDYVTWLHPGLLEQQFAKKGLRAEVARDHDAESTFLWAERGTTGITVPATVREQIFIELMTPATLIGAVSWIIDHLAQGNPQPSSLLGCANEERVWMRFP